MHVAVLWRERVRLVRRVRRVRRGVRQRPGRRLAGRRRHIVRGVRGELPRLVGVVRRVRRRRDASRGRRSAGGRGHRMLPAHGVLRRGTSQGRVHFAGGVRRGGDGARRGDGEMSGRGTRHPTLEYPGEAVSNLSTFCSARAADVNARASAVAPPLESTVVAATVRPFSKALPMEIYSVLPLKSSVLPGRTRPNYPTARGRTPAILNSSASLPGGGGAVC